MGLKADPDEKTYPAALPVLIRLLHYYCHPHWPTLTQSVAHTESSAHLDRQRYLLISSHSCTLCIVCVQLLFLYVCVLHSYAFICASVLCVCVCVHVPALILSLVAHSLYPERKRETLAPLFFTYGNSPVSPARSLTSSVMAFCVHPCKYKID